MIIGERLRLRRWTANDIIYLDAIFGDPEVMEFSDRGALSKSEQQVWLDTQLSQAKSMERFGTNAIEFNTSGKVSGYVSLSQDLARIGPEEVEIGIRLARSVWGQGYAAEAILTLVNAVDPLGRIVAIVDPNNHRSVKLMKRVGMIYDRQVMFAGYDYPDHIYAMDSPRLHEEQSKG
ncbi:MAG: GNAT family N-acetyltransferase [Pseudomonadota bacterium]